MMTNDNMYKFVMYAKSYLGDKLQLENLVESFNLHNKDNIKLYISVPKDEYSFFTHLINSNIELMSDEDYASEYMTNKKQNNFSIGYINQEICKLSFWELGKCENYLCLDSDAYFIRDFYISDFMHDDDTPYTVLVMDKDLSIEKHYRSYWKIRQNCIKRIYEKVGLDDKRLRTCHNMQVLNRTVLKSLKEDFMSKEGYSYLDLILYSPFEFTWYNAWFQKCGLIKEYAVEPFFKMFHMKIEYTFSRLKLINQNNIKDAYVGIVLNGNWNKEKVNYQKPNLIHKLLYAILKKYSK